MMLRKFSKTITTTGAAESATGEGRLEFGGIVKVYAIVLDFTSQPATTDVTITDAGESVTSNINVQANANADKVYYPRAVATKAADGTASALTEVVPVAEALKIAVAQGTANAAAVKVIVIADI